MSCVPSKGTWPSTRELISSFVPVTTAEPEDEVVMVEAVVEVEADTAAVDGTTTATAIAAAVLDIAEGEAVGTLLIGEVAFALPLLLLLLPLPPPVTANDRGLNKVETRLVLRRIGEVTCGERGRDIGEEPVAFGISVNVLCPHTCSKCFIFQGSILVCSFSSSCFKRCWFSGVNSPSASRSFHS